MLFDLIGESKKIIGIDTSGTKGTRPLARHLARFCERAGLTVSWLGPQSGKAADVNLVAHTARAGSRNLCAGGLALVTHLDTVPGGNPSYWTQTGGDPWKATLKDGRLYGLGSADTKLDFLCKLLALEKVGVKNLKLPLALIGTFGEERSLGGARWLRDSGRLSPRFASIGEPSELKAVVAHKGILYMRAVFRKPARGKGPFRVEEFRGKAAHGSMPHLGDNAIEKAVRRLRALGDVEVTEISGGTVHNVVPEFCRMTVRRSEGLGPCALFLTTFFEDMEKARAYLKKQSNAAFDPPRTTDNVGVVRMLKDGSVEIEFDFRLIPETDIDELLEIFESFEKRVPGGRIEKIRSNPPLNTSKTSEMARRIGKAQSQVGLHKAFVVKSGNTEGPIFAEMGAEAVILGPGRAVGNIHAPNEHNEISQLLKAVEFYTAFLRGFC